MPASEVTNCHTCSSPARQQIDEWLTQGVPLRKIAAETGLTKSSLSRHRQAGHVLEAEPDDVSQEPFEFSEQEWMHLLIRAAQRYSETYEMDPTPPDFSTGSLGRDLVENPKRWHRLTFAQDYSDLPRTRAEALQSLASVVIGWMTRPQLDALRAGAVRQTPFGASTYASLHGYVHSEPVHKSDSDREKALTLSRETYDAVPELPGCEKKESQA